MKYILKKISFDNMENHDPINVEIINIFIDGDETAYKQASDYISEMPPQKLYFGYDHQLYPQFIFEKIRVK